MKAAVVDQFGQAPAYGDFAEPVARDDEVCVSVTASALTNFAKVRAAGKHYSFAVQPPFVVGIDRVERLDDGRRVYRFSANAVWRKMHPHKEKQSETRFPSNRDSLQRERGL